ncbi:hypothetical protein COO60DRAFT_626881 [Scenedesmus sp. NREL 46B-D3]|nr:hypothetical protein COO60DRAFT_626881 [Scenedesmus sp. NREL 46B-D3]
MWLSVWFRSRVLALAVLWQSHSSSYSLQMHWPAAGGGTRMWAVLWLYHVLRFEDVHALQIVSSWWHGGCRCCCAGP